MVKRASVKLSTWPDWNCFSSGFSLATRAGKGVRRDSLLHARIFDLNRGRRDASCGRKSRWDYRWHVWRERERGGRARREEGCISSAVGVELACIWTNWWREHPTGKQQGFFPLVVVANESRIEILRGVTTCYTVRVTILNRATLPHRPLLFSDISQPSLSSPPSVVDREIIVNLWKVVTIK